MSSGNTVLLLRGRWVWRLFVGITAYPLGSPLGIHPATVWMGDGTLLDLADLEQDRHFPPKTQILGHLPRLKTNGDLALARLITLQQKQLVFDLSP